MYWDWAQLTLFFLIMSRMSGFILFNPLFGRQSVPGIVKSGLIMLLSVMTYTMTSYTPAVPDSIVELAVRLILEMALGYLVGIVMNLFFYIPLLGGETIDIQMGMSMGRTYDWPHHRADRIHQKDTRRRLCLRLRRVGLLRRAQV